MRPVIETIIDKNGAETTRFNPTPAMIAFALKRAEFPEIADNECAERTGISRTSPAQWKVRYGSMYTSWLEEFVEQRVENLNEVIEAVGIAQALQPGNYQYWRDIARSRGIIKDTVQPQSITINTDFTAIMAAVGGDLERARANILAKARGMEIEGEPRVALGPPGGEHPGAGDRASALQGEPVALAGALGRDGGRSEQGEAIPAVPERPTLTGTYVVLDEGEVPSRS